MQGKGREYFFTGSVVHSGQKRGFATTTSDELLCSWAISCVIRGTRFSVLVAPASYARTGLDLARFELMRERVKHKQASFGLRIYTVPRDHRYAFLPILLI